MERYANLSGDSGVAFYEMGADFIRVQFSDGAIYLYNYGSAGSANVEHMKGLAKSGRGLGSFIIKNVRKKYARKER
jgi:hypothetical protein